MCGPIYILLALVYGGGGPEVGICIPVRSPNHLPPFSTIRFMVPKSVSPRQMHHWWPKCPFRLKNGSFWCNSIIDAMDCIPEMQGEYMLHRMNPVKHSYPHLIAWSLLYTNATIFLTARGVFTNANTQNNSPVSACGPCMCVGTGHGSHLPILPGKQWRFRECHPW